MQYRPLGKTGLDVSAIGLGTWAMGGDRWGPIDDAESLAALDQARNLGVNFFDTADSYGRGHSEEVLGKWLKTVARDRVYHPVISTTIPGAKNPQQVTENVAAAEQTLTCTELALIDHVVPHPAS